MAVTWHRRYSRERPGGRHLDAHRALLVGAAYLDVEVGQSRQRGRCRVAVAVPCAGAHHGDLGSHRREQRWIGRRAAVVRHRHGLCDQQLRALEQVGVSGDLGVAREQEPSPRMGDPEHHRGVVQLAARRSVRPARWRSEHLDLEVTDDGPVTGDGRSHRDAGLGCPREDQLRVRQRGGHRPEPDRPDTERREDIGDPTDVVQVGMGDDDEVEPPTAVRT